MKILIIGGTGTIGKAVAAQLAPRHEVIIAAYSNGEVQVDISDISSIKQMYNRVGKMDAVIATTGKVDFSLLTEMTPEKYSIGINNKLMGQVNLVLTGIPYVNDQGSFTLTSGILSEDPIRYGSSASMVNAAIDAFVKAAAIEIPRGIRINSINPTLVAESQEIYGDYFHGFNAIPAARIALAYCKSVEGAQTGQNYKVW